MHPALWNLVGTCLRPIWSLVGSWLYALSVNLYIPGTLSCCLEDTGTIELQFF
jgi:hypothetical protein